MFSYHLVTLQKSVRNTSADTLGSMVTQTCRAEIPRRYRRLARRCRGFVTSLIYVMLLTSLTPIHSSAGPQPEAVVTTASYNIADALRKHHDELVVHPEKLYVLIENTVVPHFDVDTIARLVLGPHWRYATMEQRRHSTDAFKRLVINSYAKGLLLHSNKEIQVQPVRASELRSHRVSVHGVVSSRNNRK